MMGANHLSVGVATVLCLIAFQLGHRLLRTKGWCARWTVFFILSLLSIPSLLAAVYYSHILPEREWFYAMRSWRGFEFLVIFAGGAGGAVAALLPRFLAVVPLFLTIAVAVIPYLKPLMNPLPSAAFEGHWQGDACLQSTASTCGPASVASILKSMEVESTEREIASAAFTSGSGTEAWYLARYVRSRGLLAKFDFKKGFSPDEEFPAMVGVRMAGYGHFIAVISVVDSEVTFVDPLSGKHRIPLDEFLKRYQFTGFRMVVGKPPA